MQSRPGLDMFIKQMNKILLLLFIIPLNLISQNQTISFRDGVDGYNGTVDTYIDNTNPNTPYGTSTGILWDGSPAELTTFIRFDNLFVSQGGPIPNNSYIVSATLTYYVYDAGDDAAVSEVLLSWDNSLTWNQFNFSNDIGTFVGNAESGTANTYESFDVTSSLSSWSANPSLNNGWIFQFTGSNGSDVYSSEWATVNQRPELTVVYSDNFPPDPPVVIFPADGATEIIHSPALMVYVTDPEGDNLTVTFYGRPLTVSAEPDFTIVGIPDTQYYTNGGGPVEAFNAQTQWMVANKNALNIVFAAQLGDCVQNGDTYLSEWQIVDNAWSIIEDPITTGLADGIPYGIGVGNHDQTPNGGGYSASTSLFNQFFGVSRFDGRAYYGGHQGSNNDNSFQLFSAGGMDFIHIHMEYDTSPEPEVLDWADALLQTYSSRRAIVSSHYIIGLGTPGSFGAQGQAIYDNLKDNPNLFLMLCGHIHGEGSRVDTYNGNTVHTLLSDYQDYPNGGNGFLRYMIFKPAEDQIYVYTYSPYLDQYETDANSQFVIDYPMSGSEFQVIGTNTNVSSGSNTSIVWPDLERLTEYEWYVTVDDGNSIITSPGWTFTTRLEDDPLPILLTSFDGVWTETGIDLEWMVGSEIENAGFILERSRFSENGPFTEIASYQYLDQLRGRGNASESKTYHYLDRNIENGQIYFYRLADVSNSGVVTYHQVITVQEEVAIPDFKLLQNYPNPFNPETTIRYAVPKPERIKIRIYNILGEEIKTLVDQFHTPGSYSIVWDGTDNQNNSVSNGIYFYKIEADHFQKILKMIYTK